MYINKVEAVNQLISLVCFIILNISRFNHTGKVCSGDYLNETQDYDNVNYLFMKG